MKRRSPRHYARNTALATLGLYAILMLVVLSLVAGAESARNATPDNTPPQPSPTRSARPCQACSRG
ncbi:hypothetical protein ACRS7U_01950 [Pseudomonas aeruginosa]|uniref:hypothetical protein n=1 Tax=Pseudomonas aeruginosa TaxID=287 RepID=UPI003EE221BE